MFANDILIASSEGLSRASSAAKACVENSPIAFQSSFLRSMSGEQSAAVAAAKAASARLQLALGPMVQVHVIVNDMSDCFETAESTSQRAPPVVLFSPTLAIANVRDQNGVDADVSAAPLSSRTNKLGSFLSATLDMGIFLAASALTPQLCSTIQSFRVPRGVARGEKIEGPPPTWFTGHVLCGHAVEGPESNVDTVCVHSVEVDVSEGMCEASCWLLRC
jgi:hypothetical protein